MKISRSSPWAPLALRHSLRWRLPVLFALLVVAMLGTFLWATHQEVESTLVAAAEERGAAAAAQVARLLESAVARAASQDAEALGDPALQAFLVAPTDGTREAAEAALAPLVAVPSRRVELWDARERLALAMDFTGEAEPGEDPPFVFPPGSAPTYDGFSELRAAGRGSYFDLVSPVEGEAGTVGHLRRFGRITSSSGGAIRRLIGSQAALKVGAPAGGVWTDFFGLVEPPPLAGRGSPGGWGQWVGAADPIEGTPWVAWVGFPRAEVVEPARDFLRRMGSVALLFVVVGVALAALVGGRLTQPLHALSHGAEEIAAGRYGQRVAPGRRDEIGRLSEAFNTMAARVEEAHGALAASHERTHFALAAARIAVWKLDTGSGRMICSESLRLIHGLADEAPLPNSLDAFLALVDPEDRQSVRAGLEDAVRGGGTFDLRFRSADPSGEDRWVEVKGRARAVGAGAPPTVLGVSIDVTERTRLESHLQQAQKMDAIGQLAGGIAHDFNNLLTAIVGYADMLLEDAGDAIAVRDGAAEIAAAAERGAQLTRQLLAFGRRQILRPRVVDVARIVAGSEKLLRRLIGSNVVLFTEIEPGLAAVRVDSSQLDQVLVNLAVNARDAMAGGGRLTLGAANALLEEEREGEHGKIPPGRYVKLWVSDTGSGIDAETRRHLFEPFYTTKPAGRGSGLGLATVFGIVQQSGGHILIDSTVGVGTTFEIFLPATDETPVEEPRAPAVRVRRRGSGTILLVDDDAQVRSVTCAVLERLGYRVLTAADGEQALARLEGRETPPDLVVSDVVMPGMSGPQLAARLRRDHPGLRVLFTSGYSGEALERHRVETRGALFLPKPYTPSELALKVREGLS